MLYRGYVFDWEVGLYYLQSRYYIPEIGRFLNADGLVSTGQGVLGNNMFAYCGNNPVCRIDPSGKSWIIIGIVAVVAAVVCTGCTKTSPAPTPTPTPTPPPVQSNPRSELANAPDLDISTANPETYNCYGNGIGKQILADPSGYVVGDSTRRTFDLVKKDLGSGNVRELTSASAPIADNEFKVAMKCGPTDYHFIRLTDNGWYNKSGTLPGLFVAPVVVQADIWYSMGMYNGGAFVLPSVYYDDETIYFAVKVGWDD